MAPRSTRPGGNIDPFIAPDQSWLIFASERPGGYGAADLYVSFRRPDGTWGEPKNLGPSVNTAGSEYTPMLSPDGRYLFFTRGRFGDDIYWVDVEGDSIPRSPLKFPARRFAGMRRTPGPRLEEKR